MTKVLAVFGLSWFSGSNLVFRSRDIEVRVKLGLFYDFVRVRLVLGVDKC